MRGVQVPQEMWKAFKGLKNLDVVFNIQTVLLLRGKKPKSVRKNKKEIIKI